jgi:hypothetical protein
MEIDKTTENRVNMESSWNEKIIKKHLTRRKADLIKVERLAEQEKQKQE